MSRGPEQYVPPRQGFPNDCTFLDYKLPSPRKMQFIMKGNGQTYYYGEAQVEPDGEFNGWEQIARNRSAWLHPLVPFDYNRVVPIYRSGWTIASEVDLNSTFIKKPNFFKNVTNLWDGTPPARIMEREIETCEILRVNPHPNIAVYRGVTHDEWNRITGACFARYPMNLHAFVKSDSTFDTQDVLDQIKAGIEHLHSIGLTHQDIKPANCLVDPTFSFKPRVVLGDFDSVHRIGETLHTKWGTTGWTTSSEYADRDNDFYGLRMVEIWLENKGGGDPEEGAVYPGTSDILKHNGDIEADFNTEIYDGPEEPLAYGSSVGYNW